MVFDIHIGDIHPPDISAGGKSHLLTLSPLGEGWTCVLDGKVFSIEARMVRPNVLSLLIEGSAYEIRRDVINSETRIWVKHTPYIVKVRDPRALRGRSQAGERQSPQKLIASMPGKVLRVMVAVKDQVEAGQALAVVEAMKMQNEIKSPVKGIVTRIVEESSQVKAGDVLAIVDPE